MIGWLHLPHWAPRISDLLDEDGRPKSPGYAPQIILGDKEPKPIVSNTFPLARKGRWIKVVIRPTEIVDALAELGSSGDT